MKKKKIVALVILLLPILGLLGFAIYQCSAWVVLEQTFPLPEGKTCTIRLIENPKMSSALTGWRSEFSHLSLGMFLSCKK